MTGPKGVGRRWTPAEERQLRDLLDAGMTAAKVATKLGRTRQAIYARLQHIYRKRNKTKVGNVRGPDKDSSAIEFRHAVTSHMRSWVGYRPCEFVRNLWTAQPRGYGIR
jgi:IS30 family transposase